MIESLRGALQAIKTHQERTMTDMTEVEKLDGRMGNWETHYLAEILDRIANDVPASPTTSPRPRATMSQPYSALAETQLTQPYDTPTTKEHAQDVNDLSEDEPVAAVLRNLQQRSKTCAAQSRFDPGGGVCCLGRRSHLPGVFPPPSFSPHPLQFVHQLLGPNLVPYHRWRQAA